MTNKIIVNFIALFLFLVSTGYAVKNNYEKKDKNLYLKNVIDKKRDLEQKRDIEKCFLDVGERAVKKAKKEKNPVKKPIKKKNKLKKKEIEQNLSEAGEQTLRDAEWQRINEDIEKLHVHESSIFKEKNVGAKKKYIKSFYDSQDSIERYKLPAWPFYMLYTQNDNKNLFRIDLKYDYATNAYDSSGSSKDITSLAFGEKDIQWQDLLMTLRLDKSGILKSYKALNPQTNAERINAGIPSRVAWNLIKDELADKSLQFYGNVQELGTSINFFRYLIGKSLALGFQVPFAYKVHKLKLDSPIDSFESLKKAVKLTTLNNTSVAKDAAAYGAAISVLEHNMMSETLNYLLEPKGLSYLPKMSIIGIGDVVTFLNSYIKTKTLERVLVGAKISWPTAKEAVAHKVWAPQLGNGFTAFSVYASMLFDGQRKYLNPHMFVQATWNSPGHKKTRVPRIIKFDGKVVDGTGEIIDGINYYKQVVYDGADTEVNKFLEDEGVSFAQAIEYTQDLAYTEYDTQVPAFADNVKEVRIQSGAQVEMQLGNMFEGFIFRNAFLDLYYNFRAKWKDYIGGNLVRDIWAVDLLKDNTYQIEHKIGGEFSYQFDSNTRFKLGLDFVFAGRNVAQNLEVFGSIAVEF